MSASPSRQERAERRYLKSMNDPGTVEFSANGGSALLPDLERHLAQRVGAYPRDGADALFQALADLATPAQFRSIVSGFLSDPAVLRRAEDRSYLHRNGFLRLTLAPSSSYYLRLHVWDTRHGGLPNFPESIHNHNSDFASVILTGGYRHEIFYRSSAGESYYQYDYNSQRGSGSFSLEPKGPVPLALNSNSYLGANTSYTLTTDVLHRVIPRADSLTASLVLKGPTVNPVSQMYTQEMLAVNGEVSVLPLPQNAYAKYAHELLDIPDILEDVQNSSRTLIENRGPHQSRRLGR